MKHCIVSAVAALAFLSMAAPASAQHTHPQSEASHAGGRQDPAKGSEGLPEQCRTAAPDQAVGQHGTGHVQGASMPGMSEVQTAYMDAMTKMHAPMMTGVHAKDPDVAFICGMIPHHQGAIDMARIQLKYGDDPEAKRLAERVIKDQGKEIEEMTAWLKKNAKKVGP